MIIKNGFQKNLDSSRSGFTLVELGVTLGVVFLLLAMLLPAFARNQNHSNALRCRNNLKQLTTAWRMYSADNAGSLVSAFPSYGGFKGSWCAGSASFGGGPDAYVYGGADPTGITRGLLWPYVKELSFYKCYADHRIATMGLSNYIGKPILRSVSMNSYLAGTSYGISPEYSPIMATVRRNPSFPVLLKESEILHPARIMVFLEEDPMSINDGMFAVDMSSSLRMIDLPSRLHNYTYGISFADGHVDGIKLTGQSLGWTPVSGSASAADVMRLVTMATNPLR